MTVLDDIATYLAGREEGFDDRGTMLLRQAGVELHEKAMVATVRERIQKAEHEIVAGERDELQRQLDQIHRKLSTTFNRDYTEATSMIELQLHINCNGIQMRLPGYFPTCLEDWSEWPHFKRYFSPQTHIEIIRLRYLEDND